MNFNFKCEDQWLRFTLIDLRGSKRDEKTDRDIAFSSEIDEKFTARALRHCWREMRSKRRSTSAKRNLLGGSTDHFPKRIHQSTGTYDQLWHVRHFSVRAQVHSFNAFVRPCRKLKNFANLFYSRRRDATFARHLKRRFALKQIEDAAHHRFAPARWKDTAKLSSSLIGFACRPNIDENKLLSMFLEWRFGSSTNYSLLSPFIWHRKCYCSSCSLSLTPYNDEMNIAVSCWGGTSIVLFLLVDLDNHSKREKKLLRLQ